MYDMYPKTWSEQADRQAQAPASRRRRRVTVTQPEVPVRAEH